MPIDNTLNISELMRRIGAKGDSLGSAPLLESLRLSLLIGDLSELVPPVAGPYGHAAILAPISGIGNVNSWTLECRAPGGLSVQIMNGSGNNNYHCFVTDANPFGAVVTTGGGNFSFGQVALSIFSNRVPALAVAPVGVFTFGGFDPKVDSNFANWIGPGQFFNVETQNQNASQLLSILWKEYTGALNPG